MKVNLAASRLTTFCPRWSVGVPESRRRQCRRERGAALLAQVGIQTVDLLAQLVDREALRSRPLKQRARQRRGVPRERRSLVGLRGARLELRRHVGFTRLTALSRSAFAFAFAGPFSAGSSFSGIGWAASISARKSLRAQPRAPGQSRSLLGRRGIDLPRAAERLVDELDHRLRMADVAALDVNVRLGVDALGDI